MNWQIAMALQVVVSSFMTLFTRRLTLSLGKALFSVGVVLYLAIALAGLAFGSIHAGGLVAAPPSSSWLFLIIEGVCIPASWLVQYQLIRYLGAANAVIVATLNTIGAALLGILLLGDALSVAFIVGAGLVIFSMVISLGIRPDATHEIKQALAKKILLAVVGASLFAFGMYAEKRAINIMGSWNYMTIGWGMQAVGATMLFVVFGMRELKILKARQIRNVAILGLFTSVAGLLYVYALGKGTLSHTIVAASGKVALTLVLAALILGERNELKRRALAFAASTVGLLLVLRVIF